jgi:vacuolar protein sorting-associated protein 3
VDGEWKDDEIKDPLEQIMALLNESRDRALVQRWGLWLVKRDTASGLKVFSSLSPYIQTS